jgi:hypothetical protein
VHVSDEFFDLLRETCRGWLAHLEDLDYRPGHLNELTGWLDSDGQVRDLPPWIIQLPKAVGHDGAVRKDAAARVAAAVLAVDVRSVYRKLAG